MVSLALLELSTTSVTEVGADEGFGIGCGSFHGHAAEIASLEGAAFMDEIDDFLGAFATSSEDDIEVIAKKLSKVESFGDWFFFGHGGAPKKEGREEAWREKETCVWGGAREK